MLNNLNEKIGNNNDDNTQNAERLHVVQDTKQSVVPIKAGFTQFEVINAIYDSKILSEVKLTAGARLVLISLARHYNPSNDEFFPSYSCIASHTGVSKKSVERAIKELVGAGLITYRTEKVNRYRFTGRFFASVKLTHDHRQNDDSSQRQNVAQTNNQEKRMNNKEKNNFSFSEGLRQNSQEAQVSRPNGVVDFACKKGALQKNYVGDFSARARQFDAGYSKTSKPGNGASFGVHYTVPAKDRNGGSSFTPSVSTTNEYLQGLRTAREEACSPLDFDFETAKRWYGSLSAPLRGTALAKKVVAKYPELLE